LGISIFSPKCFLIMYVRFIGYELVESNLIILGDYLL